MTDRPWETEPDSLDFEADGLLCAMRRNHYGVWCGYVGVGPQHPLYGLPTNHPLKLPRAWFEGRNSREGYGPIDLMLHAMSGAQSMGDACPISLAFEVHGGVTFAEDTLSDREPGRWWFGFNCGHAGDLMPHLKGLNEVMGSVIASMPEHVRGKMREIFAKQDREMVYRDQQYVVSECQSLAAQLNAIVAVIERIKDRSDNQRN